MKNRQKNLSRTLTNLPIFSTWLERTFVWHVIKPFLLLKSLAFAFKTVIFVNLIWQGYTLFGKPLRYERQWKGKKITNICYLWPDLSVGNIFLASSTRKSTKLVIAWLWATCYVRSDPWQWLAVGGVFLLPQLVKRCQLTAGQCLFHEYGLCNNSSLNLS